MNIGICIAIILGIIIGMGVYSIGIVMLFTSKKFVKRIIRWSIEIANEMIKEANTAENGY